MVSIGYKLIAFTDIFMSLIQILQKCLPDAGSAN